ncbi:DUF4277 domain-containing protein [Vibrio sp. F13]|nr:DUF4277 domain-containing protein [Vibrio sp. F13]TKF64175.1 DUF4277 domain-containing protein [Vibrio sp. F13]TKF69471.1 DUF4277 domain-containing protein [Vibrio sp. F13]
MSTQHVIKRLDRHIGLIAAFCHEIGLPLMTNAVIPKYSNHNVFYGDEVLALIFNGLCIQRRRLHILSYFFRLNLYLNY